jgi:hypothetical protein
VGGKRSPEDNRKQDLTRTCALEHCSRCPEVGAQVRASDQGRFPAIDRCQSLLQPAPNRASGDAQTPRGFFDRVAEVDFHPPPVRAMSDHPQAPTATGQPRCGPTAPQVIRPPVGRRGKFEGPRAERSCAFRTFEPSACPLIWLHKFLYGRSLRQRTLPKSRGLRAVNLRREYSSLSFRCHSHDCER